MLCYLLLASVDEKLSLAFEIGLEWVVCHKMGLSTTFKLLPSTMAKNAKIKPQVKRLLCFMKRGYGRGHRVKRSKWSGFVVEAIS